MLFLYTHCDPCIQPVQLTLEIFVKAIHYFIFAIIREKSKEKFYFHLTDYMYCTYLFQNQCTQTEVSNLMHSVIQVKMLYI